MSRGPCPSPDVPVVAARLALLARATALALPRMAQAPGPLLAVVVADAEGVMFAVRNDGADIGPSELDHACGTLLDLSPPVGLAVAMVVSAGPAFDHCPAHRSARVWRDLRRRFDGAGVTLVDWLLVADGVTRSLAVTEAQP